MKKIMFNDKYGLTEAVLSGRKTQTRRIITCPQKRNGVEVRGFYVWRRPSDGCIAEISMYDDDEFTIDGGNILPKYKVGEIVAIAQSYKDAGVSFIPIDESKFAKNERQKPWGFTKNTKGYSNKMFVRADVMPHQIRITNIKIEKLQDISDEDVIKEGFRLESINENMGNCLSHWEYQLLYEDKLGRPLWFSDKSAQEAFSRLIDKVSGNGTWESNPYVFVYEFELLK